MSFLPHESVFVFHHALRSKRQGNRYNSPAPSQPNTTSYHYSNTNGSYYYSNSNGSTYYNSGRGSSTYTTSSGYQVSKSSE
ncbi:hypothetical protein Ae201684P_009209 [Aphanomyces euteiches]|nr:hypothetical protein Ae201684P_009209 [Aphanomyces euteiches]